MNIWRWFRGLFVLNSFVNNAANLLSSTSNKLVGQHYSQLWKTETGCNRTWPSLELFLPIGLAEPIGQHREAEEMRRRNREFGVWLIRSLFLFWPLEVSKVTLRLIFDEEVGPTMPKGNRTHLYTAAWNSINYYVDAYKKYRPFDPSSLFRVNFTAISPVYRRGYDRQQWVMFWADNFTTAEYVGFVDTDTLFTTYVDREDLFEDGKPVVNGRIGVNPRPPWSQVQATSTPPTTFHHRPPPPTTFHHLPPPTTTAHHLPPPSTTFHHLPPPSTTFHHLPPPVNSIRHFTLLRLLLFYPPIHHHHQVPANTLNFTGLKEPLRCMSYFPVVIKTAHLVDFRRYIAARHGMPFDEVFHRWFRYKGIHGYNSQFNMMCAYLYTYRRSEVSEWGVTVVGE